MWEKAGIRVSKKGRLSLEDICENILKIFDVDDIANKIPNKNKYYMNNNVYITEPTAILLIMNTNNNLSINFCAKYLYDYVGDVISDYDISKEKYYEYRDNKFMYFEFNNLKWFKGKDIGMCLNYSNTKDAILTHVSDENKCNFKNLRTLANKNFHLFMQKSFIDPKTVFINLDGLVELLLKANKASSIDLARYFGINVHQKFLRKEIDIVYHLDLFCESAGIKSKHLKSYSKKKKMYTIDYHLSDYNIAIEIDEFNHKNYNPKHEVDREKILKKLSGCKFIRCNPDDPEFSIAGLIGEIHRSVTKKLLK